MEKKLVIILVLILVVTFFKLDILTIIQEPKTCQTWINEEKAKNNIFPKFATNPPFNWIDDQVYCITNLQGTPEASFGVRLYGPSGELIQELDDSVHCNITTEIGWCDNCISDWRCTKWGDCINSLRKRTCTDLNLCTNPKPRETETCTVICEPDWECGNFGKCIDNEKRRQCIDLNNCGIFEGDIFQSEPCEGEIILEEDCEGGIAKCIDEEFYLCEDGEWINNGKIEGLCGKEVIEVISINFLVVGLLVFIILILIIKRKDL